MGIVVHKIDGCLQELHQLYRTCDLLNEVLLFPRGGDGFQRGLNIGDKQELSYTDFKFNCFQVRYCDFKTIIKCFYIPVYFIQRYEDIWRHSIPNVSRSMHESRNCKSVIVYALLSFTRVISFNVILQLSESSYFSLDERYHAEAIMHQSYEEVLSERTLNVVSMKIKKKIRNLWFWYLQAPWFSSNRYNNYNYDWHRRYRMCG